MAAEVLGVKYEYHLVDLEKGDHKKPEYEKVKNKIKCFFVLLTMFSFLQLNPNCKVPTLKDGNTVITDSRPAALYLCNQAITPPKTN